MDLAGLKRARRKSITVQSTPLTVLSLNVLLLADGMTNDGARGADILSYLRRAFTNGVTSHVLYATKCSEARINVTSPLVTGRGRRVEGIKSETDATTAEWPQLCGVRAGLTGTR